MTTQLDGPGLTSLASRWATRSSFGRLGWRLMEVSSTADLEKPTALSQERADPSSDRRAGIIVSAQSPTPTLAPSADLFVPVRSSRPS